MVRGATAEIEPGQQGLVRNILDIDNALQVGLTVNYLELSPLEFRGLLMLRRARATRDEAQAGMDKAAAIAAQQIQERRQGKGK